MKFIYPYKLFIGEQITDETDESLKRNRVQDLDKKVKEYNSKQGEITTFFENPKLTSELREKELKKYLDPRGVFKNDLLKIWWDICNLTHEVKMKEQKISSVESDIQKKQSQSKSSDVDTKLNYNQIITNLKDISQSHTKDVSDLREKILKLNNEIKEKVQEYKDFSLKTKKELQSNV